MKLEFEVPDGEYCGECVMQREFFMDESEMPTVGISRLLHARSTGVFCFMFKERLCITECGEVVKCAGCREAGR